MSLTLTLKEKIKNGYLINKEEALSLLEEDVNTLAECANEIREHFCGNAFDICTITNGKSGKCSEDCKYCAQSAYYDTEIEEYDLLDCSTLEKEALSNWEKGILRYSVVTSGRTMTDLELEEICKSYKKIKSKYAVSLCASHGLLSYQQLLKLKEAGVTRYHNNLEASSNYFPKICTTHSFTDKVNTIQAAQKAGLEVCSGIIMGLGERMEDRIDVMLEIRSLGVKSIPLNILRAIKGTPLENMPVLSGDEIKRSVAIFRFLVPNAALRLAGGRGLMNDKGKAVFLAGSNAAISGDMLTTDGISIEYDLAMLKELGFEIRKI